MRSERKEILSGEGRAHFGRVIVGSLEKGTQAFMVSSGARVWGNKDLEVYRNIFAWLVYNSLVFLNYEVE